MIENKNTTNMRILEKPKIVQCVVVVFGVLLDIFFVDRLTGMFIFGFSFMMLFEFIFFYGFLVALAMYLNYNIGAIVFQCANKVVSKMKTNDQRKKKFVVLFVTIFYLLFFIVASAIVALVFANIYSGVICSGDECSGAKLNIFLISLRSFLIMLILNVAVFAGLLRGYRKNATENKEKIESKDSVAFIVNSNDAKSEKMVVLEPKGCCRPRSRQYLLGISGFIVSIFTIVSTFDFGLTLIILIMTGGIIGIMILNYNTGCIISYYIQKLMQKISFDEKYEVLFIIIVNILYQLFCVLISVGILLLKNGKGGQITSCADFCSTIDVGAVFLWGFIIIVILNITTLVGSINKLASYQERKKNHTNKK